MSDCLRRFDLHTHSLFSDGSMAPRDIVFRAKAMGLSMLALTDHDTMAGVDEAVDAGREAGVTVIAGVEFDAQAPFELHILGLGLDAREPKLIDALETTRRRRDERNEAILDKLEALGMEVRPCFEQSEGTTTRLNIALALVAAGYAQSIADAFSRYIGFGRPAYASVERYSPRELIELIGSTGGVSVLAHPSKLRTDVHALIKELKGYGLDGIEAFYPTTTAGERDVLLSYARQFGLFATCGSDFHGVDRRHAQLGCACEQATELSAAYDIMIAKAKQRGF